MPRLRTIRRLPSPATAISLLALVIAMSGTAYAATGGTFILGHANKETSTATLASSKGTPLVLSAPPGKAPLAVSDSVQIPKLNASELGGHPAFDYVTGHGQVSRATDTVSYGSTLTVNLPSALSRDYQWTFDCAPSGVGEMTVAPTVNNFQLWWLGASGQGYQDLNHNNQVIVTTPSGNPVTWVLEASFSSSVVSTDLSMAVNTTNQTCTYAAQSISGG